MVTMITGASSGLGKELAIQFSRKQDVIINGRDMKRLQEVYKLCQGPTALPNKNKLDMVGGDLTNENTLKTLEEIAKERDIDILVNNAGVYKGKLKEVMGVNFYAPVELTKRILPIFLKKHKGLIVNINSISGKKGSRGEIAYSASKHALKGYFDSLRYDLTRYGVRILDIYLGKMDTQMTKGKDQHLFMNPKEVAKVIVNNCELYGSLSVNEINIGRRNYE